MLASNDNHAPVGIELTAVVIFILGAALVVGIPCAAIWLRSVWA